MKVLSVLFFVFCFLVFETKADEGMWLPYSLSNKSLSEMQRLGCKLTKEQIFSFNQPSIKDAIVQFGGGCTGELISAQGLLLTNHHCGLGQIQKHSSIEKDYLTQGFWANNKKEELPNEGLSVSFLSRVEDVTSEILKGVTSDMDELEREAIIEEKINKYIEGREQKNKYLEIVQFYKGNQYILFEYDVYRDVRLVACPPWGIGKFGADTDNWTWPRHKGDFCMFRVYTAPDGSPAEYSIHNEPMKSKHFLPISMKGVSEGDYAMILGYPGSTDRYSTSYEIKSVIESEGPAIIACRTTKLSQYRKHMDADPNVFIKYASKQASVSNYWKYYIGQVKQLQRNKVYEERISIENEFMKWVEAEPSHKIEYGDIFTEINEKCKNRNNLVKAEKYHIEAGLRGSEAVAFSMRFIRAEKALKSKSSNMKDIISSLKQSAILFFKDYDKDTDRDVTIALLNLFYKDLSSEYRPLVLNKEGKKNGGEFTNFVDQSFSKSIFVDPKKLQEWFEKPKSLEKDPVYALMKSIYDSYNIVIEMKKESDKALARSERLLMKGLKEMTPDKNMYPDANFTMRLTYGQVASYVPENGKFCDYYTTIEGIMQKEKPGNWEFDVPKKLKDLYLSKDYGQYVDKNGNLVVNFITTNDITGGNSGSPVIDGDGNLIGLAFDGNWEAMSGDLSFENTVQRTICMDARYLLFIIDKYANAQNIMDELKIVK